MVVKPEFPPSWSQAASIPKPAVSRSVDSDDDMGACQPSACTTSSSSNPLARVDTMPDYALAQKGMDDDEAFAFMLEESRKHAEITGAAVDREDNDAAIAAALSDEVEEESAKKKKKSEKKHKKKKHHHRRLRKTGEMDKEKKKSDKGKKKADRPDVERRDRKRKTASPSRSRSSSPASPSDSDDDAELLEEQEDYESEGNRLPAVKHGYMPEEEHGVGSQRQAISTPRIGHGKHYYLPATAWMLIAQEVPIEEKHHFAHICRYTFMLVLGEFSEFEATPENVIQLVVGHVEFSPFISYTVPQVDFIAKNHLLLDLGKGTEYNCALMPPYYFSLFYAVQTKINSCTETSITAQRQLNALKLKKECPARVDMEADLNAKIARSDMILGPCNFINKIYGEQVTRLINEANDGCSRVLRMNGLDTWAWIGAEAWKAARAKHPRLLARCFDENTGDYRPFYSNQAQRKRVAKRKHDGSSSLFSPATPSTPATPASLFSADSEDDERSSKAKPAAPARKRVKGGKEDHRGRFVHKCKHCGEEDTCDCAVVDKKAKALEARKAPPKERTAINLSAPPPPYSEVDPYHGQ